MPQLSRRILDVIFLIALVSLPVRLLLDANPTSPELVVGMGVIAVACWLVLRRRTSVPVLVVFWLNAYPSLILGQPMLLMVAVLLVFVTYGVRIGVRSVLIGGALMEVGWLVLHLGFMHPPLIRTAFALVTTIGNLAVPVVLGVALSRLQTAIGQLGGANTELRAANEELGEQSLLAQDLLLSQERSRAARELHDSLGNRLTAVSMSIDYAREIADHSTGQARDELTRARAEIGDALGDLRIWVRAMNPASRTAGVGLAGLNDVAASFRGTGLAVEVDVPAQHPMLGQRRELYVVRFVQEGLTNALRHGRARRVWVRARVERGQLLLELTDDGGGAIGVPFEGFGLRSLREHAADLGGTFEASNAPTGGFRIRAALPLPVMAGDDVDRQLERVR